MLVLQLCHLDMAAEDHDSHQYFLHVCTVARRAVAQQVLSLSRSRSHLAARHFLQRHRSPFLPPFLPPSSSFEHLSRSVTDRNRCAHSDHRCRNIFVEIILAFVLSSFLFGLQCVPCESKDMTDMLAFGDGDASVASAAMRAVPTV